jgi:hypothetical protein
VTRVRSVERVAAPIANIDVLFRVEINQLAVC